MYKTFTTREEARTAMQLFAADLAETGQLRVSATVARDVLWTYHAPELYQLLVLGRDWSAARYGDFITHALTHPLTGALLEHRE
ncbi:hypothetical protein [Mycobacterium angelicum]|uniref:hypothetical protein n=1 Tax=Mycobacterium angelicum TaxID=470074 RepID=UPI00111C4691|nr:hypothetical protein [Mycobacterium angelicum]MCV7199211.1 hypothetical protein [Mycobacterium angelicum]